MENGERKVLHHVTPWYAVLHMIFLVIPFHGALGVFNIW